MKKVMTERYQLKHPEGKKLSSIDLSKYKLIKEAIIHSLSNSAPISHKEMFLRVKSYLQKNKKEFTGSVEVVYGRCEVRFWRQKE
ncbi:MAG: hypothetical protein R2847_11850 [Bacteroidia bacterium]